MAKGFKTGGRKAGQPNKLTTELREILGEIVRSEIEKLPELLQELEPRDRAAILEKFTSYVIPKIQTEEGQELRQPLIINVPDCI